MKFIELQNKLVEAMKEKNRVKKTVIADMVTCAKNMAIEKGCKDNITEEITDAAILKSKKICQEQIDACPANRPDLLEGFTTCMAYIDELAPKMMSEDEIKNYLEEVLIELTSVNTIISPKIKSIVMKEVMKNLRGKADGKLVGKVLDSLLKK
jgi:uncharacterized protein YqeY